MSTTLPPPRVEQKINYLNADYGWKSWLFTTDHKRIALLYLFSITAFFFVGGAFAVLMRINLLEPDGVFSHDTYNKFFTMHGIIMVFFFLVPSIPATLGNFLIPIMIGARDLAFPRINLLSWYIYIVGGAFAMTAIVQGGVDTGWTFYAPFSTTYSNTHVIMAAIGVFISGFSSILTGLNFIVTIHKMRCPGMTWGRLPLFVWGHYATSLIQVLGTPVIAITLVLLGLERILHAGIFDPNLGGDPVLFQHLFWFYSHPAVYIMILPGMAIISEIIPTFSRKTIFGYKAIAYSSVALALLGFLVWGHHMFVAGQSDLATVVFSALTFLVAIPSGVKLFNWLATMYKGNISLETPMLYAISFILLFAIGGLTGIFLGALSTDVHLTDTYFVVAHFHYVMMGGTVIAFIGGVHYWWPKITGRMYSEKWGRIGCALVFVGFNMTFLTQFFLGSRGMPRRYYNYLDQYQPLHAFSTFGSWVLGMGLFITAAYLLASLRKPMDAPDNPWGGTTMEWLTSSPPIEHNFEEQPVLEHEPYDYRPKVKKHA
jgi:cytochrome c oxidase subunit 1